MLAPAPARNIKSRINPRCMAFSLRNGKISSRRPGWSDRLDYPAPGEKGKKKTGRRVAHEVRDMTAYFVRGSNSLIQILVSELAPDFFGGISLPVHLDVRVNKKVQRLAVLLGHQVDVSAQTKGDTVFGKISEVVIAHFGVLVGFG